MYTTSNRAKELAEKLKGGKPKSAKLKCDYIVALEELSVAVSIVEKVTEMRNALREYFKTRSPDWLNKSKCLEREVDKKKIVESAINDGDSLEMSPYVRCIVTKSALESVSRISHLEAVR